MDKLNNLNNENFGEKGSEKITPVEFTEGEKKILLKNIQLLYGKSTINSANLKEYTNDNMATLAVHKRIQELGILNNAMDILPKIINRSIPYLSKEAEAADLEKFFRIFLKEAEEIVNKRTEKNQGL